MELLIKKTIIDRDKKGVSLCKTTTDEHGRDTIERRAFRLMTVLEEDGPLVLNPNFISNINTFANSETLGQQLFNKMTSDSNE